MATIRAERPADAPAVDAVHRAVFPGEDEALLVAALRAAGHACVSLVAEVDGQIVGHIVFSPVSIAGTGQTGQGLGLAPVAVLPEHQRRGIGSQLIREGLDVCRQAGFDFVVVLGHPEYYPRFGFRQATQQGLANEYGAVEAFMVVELTPGSLPPAGLVKYGPEFSP